MISQENILIQLKAQPKKTAVMCLLIVVLVIILVRAFHKPGTASGMVNPLPASEPAAPMNEKKDTGQKVKAENFDSIVFEMIQEKNPADPVFPRRNIFAVNLNYFPKQSVPSEKGSKEHKPLDPRQFQLNSLQEQVMGFQLQSTMTGPAPTAYIDGNLVREKESYKGFVIRKIQDGKVILEAKGFSFSLFLNEK